MKITDGKYVSSDEDYSLRENFSIPFSSFPDGKGGIPVSSLPGNREEASASGDSGICVNLQPLIESDLAFVRDIYNYYIQHSTAIFYLYPLTEDEVRSTVPVGDGRYRSFLVKAGNDICGFCYISRFKPKEAFDITVEITLYLLPAFGGKGIGYKAMQLFEPYIRAAGFGNIIALITGENTSSIRLFSKCGYSECGYVHRVAEKFGRRLDLAMYQKLID